MIDKNIIPVVFALIVLSFLPSIIKCYKINEKDVTLGEAEQSKYFYVSPWYLMIVPFGYVISGLFFYSVYRSPSFYMLKFLVGYSLGLIFFFWTAIRFSRCKDSYILVTKNYVEYKYGKKLLKIDIDDVASVVVVGGYIIFYSQEKKVILTVPRIYRECLEIQNLVMSAKVFEMKNRP